MKILVTGTAGFIGYHLAKRFVALGHEVVGLDNINNYYDIRLKYGRLTDAGIPVPNDDAGTGDPIPYNQIVTSTTQPLYRFTRLKLEDKDNILALFRAEKFDAVCHLAAQAGVRYSTQNPHAYTDSNIVGFLNILEASRHNPVKHLVYASTSSVYGLNEAMPFSTHDGVDHPLSLYAATKKSCELMAHSYSWLYKIPTTGLRFFTVYGPWGRPDMALFKFTKNILENKPIDIYNYGEMQRDFTYVDDIVEGVARVTLHPPEPAPGWDPKTPDPSYSKCAYKVYNIGNSKPVKLMEFIEAIEEALGKTAEKNMLPLQPADVVATWADTSDLQNDFGYQPSTPVKNGIKQFVSWYLDFYHNQG